MNLKEFKDIMKFAIQGEVDARKFYEDVAGVLDDQSLKDMFTELANEEKSHQETLKRLYMSHAIEHFFEAGRDYHISETLEKPEVSENMKPADAIALAMKKEEEAMVQYTELAESCQSADKKKVFLDLAAMERGHKKKMEAAFVDIAYPEVW